MKTLKSRAYRRIIVKAPSRTDIRLEKRKRNTPKCALCKTPLQGYPKMTVRDSRRGHRSPNRIYGGYLCHRCLRRLIKKSVYKEYGKLI